MKTYARYSRGDFFSGGCSGLYHLCSMLSACLLFGAANAHAQSSVTLYGLLSVGMVYTDNAGGHGQTMMLSGPQQNPRFGLRGVEDLGGGISTLFVLENGFSLTNGTASQGGRMFGRQAYVGLSSTGFGTVTLGRQYDEIAQNIPLFQSGVVFGAFGAHVGDNDNIFNSFRFNNSIRYQSTNYGGLKVAGQFAFSNASGQFSNNSAWSIGGTYSRNAFQLATAYSRLNHPASVTNSGGAVDNNGYGFTSPFLASPGRQAGVESQSVFVVASSYALGDWVLAGIYSNAAFGYMDTTGLRLQNVEVSIRKSVTPSFLVGLGYIFTFGRYTANDAKPHYNQVNVGSDYFLSKRTDLYLDGIYQRAGGAAAVAQIYSLSPSTTKSQWTAILGIRHKF